jgi:hypothetical protein
MEEESSWEKLSGRCGGCIKFSHDFGDGPKAYGHCPVKNRTGAITSMDFKCEVYIPHESVRGDEPQSKAPTRNPFADPLNATKHAPSRQRRRTGEAPKPRQNPQENRRKKRALADRQPMPFGEDSMDRATLREIMQEAIEDAMGIGEVETVDRFLGGKVVVCPPDDDTQAKEISVENFLRKIVMIRDNLRVLEQKINSNKALDDAEKVQLQQYVTRCYGSMTTFNFLFKYKEDHFIGSKN